MLRDYHIERTTRITNVIPHRTFDYVEDIDKDSFSIKLFAMVKEAFFISSLKPSLNSKYESIKQNSAS